ncbi:NUDIX hydrolase [Rhizobium sp. ARZ01]|uniref:NUDIX hydrolase n=1 Tax=Rhizobium sp. ARZ01 TaxID=2769313 RepID=UPI00177C9D02|nr:NUDIX hydrolase [Rhizobium sp. ARZ01]MBD9372815.1 NUDIX hydrolase [Rhizobium sp. ARZ01]
MRPPGETSARAWPKEGEVFPIARVGIRVSGEPHPFHLEERAAIEANWQAEVSANPALYNDKMLLQSDVEISDGAISSTAHFVPFSAFLLWRKRRPPGGGYHLFGMPLVVSSDGAVIAIRMGSHTANPGRVYCAAGSLDAYDVCDGLCDLDANMMREAEEEIGFDLRKAATVGQGYHALHIDKVITVFKIFRFGEMADALLAQIERNRRTQACPEIDCAVAIFDSDPQRHSYAAFMPPILRWFFDRGQR